MNSRENEEDEPNNSGVSTSWVFLRHIDKAEKKTKLDARKQSCSFLRVCSTDRQFQPIAYGKSFLTLRLHYQWNWSPRNHS